MNINLNHEVSVILTHNGAILLNSFYIKYNIKKYFKEEDIFKTQLWELMQIFGQHLNIGFNNLPFKDNNIIFI